MSSLDAVVVWTSLRFEFALSGDVASGDVSLADSVVLAGDVTSWDVPLVGDVAFADVLLAVEAAGELDAFWELSSPDPHPRAANAMMMIRTTAAAIAMSSFLFCSTYASGESMPDRERSSPYELRWRWLWRWRALRSYPSRWRALRP